MVLMIHLPILNMRPVHFVGWGFLGNHPAPLSLLEYGLWLMLQYEAAKP
jgi:hypothetical protein